MSVTNKTEKGYLLLSEEKFDEAKTIFSEIISEDQANYEAYLGRLLAELELCDKDSLSTSSVDFSDNEDFKKALSLADEDEKKKLTDTAEQIAENKRLLSIYDSDFLESIYTRATSCEHTSESYRKNAGVLRSIGGYRDSSLLAKKYDQLADELRVKEEKEEKERAEKEKAEIEKKRKKSDSIQIKFYTVAIVILSLFLVFLICYNTFLGGLIKKNKVLDEIYPLTYDDITVLSKKEAPWFSINEDGEISFDASKYDGDGNIVIPDVFDNTLVRSIGNNAFAGENVIKSVVISDFVEAIGENAFEYCAALESVKLPSSIVQISPYAFHGCASLKDISLPNTVIRICSGAFSGCSSIKTLVLPDSVEYIEKYAFQNCTSLKSITLGRFVKDIGIRGFSNCPLFDTIYFKGDRAELENIAVAVDNGPFDNISSKDISITYNYADK